jgi:hypothetical protein
MGFLFLFFTTSIFCQPGSLIIGQLIDTPSAKTLFAGELLTELRMYPKGGLLTSLMVGLTDRFGMGVSYGGENIIGKGSVNMNPQPCVHLQYLVFDEQFLSPALVVGFHSQGYGGYEKDKKRYNVKSMGFYVVASKNTSFLGGIGLHGGVNWSPEVEDGDKDLNVFIGCHKWINQELVLLGEYNTAVNDNSNNALGSGRGYLNVGLRWSLFQRFFIEFSWKNILENRENEEGSSREVKLIYITPL